MANTNKAPKTGIRLPWYAYLFIILVYVSPFLLLTPLGLLSGLFTLEEYGLIFSHPAINAITVITFAAAFAMAFWERKFLSQYTGTPESIKKTNNKLKIVALGNIVIPIGLQILQGFAINLYIKHHELHLRSFMGRRPTLFIYMLLIGALFEM